MKRTRFWDFDARIFGEGIRQLKIVGILFTVVMCLEALLIPIGTVIQAQQIRTVEMTRSLVTLLRMHPLIVLPMYTLAPVAVLMLFSFLNKRRASDFYHAIPVTRAAMFISLFAAVMFWVLVSILASSAVSVVTCLCLSQQIQLDLSGVGMLLLNSFLGAAFVAACTALAMSITGTLFNNIVVAGLIFFAPRLLLTVCRMLIHGYVNILSGGIDGILLDASYNIPLGILTGVLSTADATTILHSYSSAAYTAVVAFVYFLAANLLFRLRKSEAAGYAAATPILQHVNRLVITFLVSLMPTSVLFLGMNSGSGSTDMYYTVVLYIVAAVAFCVYELITTKKPKQLLKVAPTFLLVLAADAAMLLGVFLGCRSALAFRPTADEIRGISFTFLENGQSSYFSRHYADIILYDKDAYAVVSERLKICAENNNAISGIGDSDGGTAYYLTVKIYTGSNSVHERRLVFSADQLKVLEKAMDKSEAYRKIFTLPERDSGISPWHTQLSTDEADAVYDTMQKESKKLSFEQLYALLTNGDYPKADNTLTQFSVEVTYRNKVYSFDVPLNTAYFPESCTLYLSYRYKSTEGMQDDMLQSLEEGNAGLDIYDNRGDSMQQYFVSPEQLTKAQLNALKNALVRKAPTKDDAFCLIWDGYDTNGLKREAVFTLSDEAFRILQEANISASETKEGVVAATATSR